MAVPIPIEFKLRGSNNVHSGFQLAQRSHSIVIREGTVVTWYSYHYIDWIRPT